MASPNISYYTVPAAWLLAFAPTFYRVQYYNAHAKRGKFSADNPRDLMAKLNEKEAKMDENVRQVISRAHAAQLNGFENLGFYAAAVVAANSAGVGAGFLNFWTLWYLLTRTAYNVAYIKGFTKPRGLFYLMSLCSMFGLFIAAGNATKGAWGAT